MMRIWKEKLMRKRDRKLLLQMGRMFLLVFAVFFVISVGSVFVKMVNDYINDTNQNHFFVLTHMEKDLENVKSLPWLVEYWQAHGKQMDIYHQEDRVAFAQEVSVLIASLGRQDAPDVTVEEARSLSEAEQKVFAEYCYLQFNDYYRNAITGITSANVKMYCLRILDQEEAVEFIEMNGNGRSSYVIGKSIPYKVSERASNLQLDHSAQTVEEFSAQVIIIETGEGKEALTYQPMIIDGECCCLVASSYDMDLARIDLLTMLRGIPAFWLVFYLLGGTFLLIRTYFLVLRPLLSIQNSVTSYMQTHDTKDCIRQMMDIRSRNEIGHLADDFSDMMIEIDRRTRRMVAQAGKEKQLETELATATNIQESILPTVTEDILQDQRFTIYASMNPAKEVGGDLYDFFYMDDDHLALVIADVSGKGIPAALFMMQTKTMIKAMVTAENELSLSETVAKVNDELCAGNGEDLFVTTWLMVVDLSSGKAVEVNAGHTKPAFSRNGEGYELVKNRHSLALGTMAGIPYTENVWQFSPGDRIFVYTDGVPEAEDAAEQQFGNERMLDALNAAPSDSQQAVLEQVRERVGEFVGDASQFDDLTMLGFTFYGKGEEE